MGVVFSKLLPADLGASESLGESEKAGVLAKSRSSCLFQTAVQALGDHPVPLGPGKMSAEQKIKLSLGGNFFFLGLGT